MSQTTALIITGYEFGLLDTAGGGLIDSTSGTASIQSSVVRSGTYALRTNPTTSTSYVTQSHTAATALYGRVYLRFATVPDTDVWVFHHSSTVGAPDIWMGIAYNSSTGKLRPFVLADAQTPQEVFGTDGPAISADGLWHRLDYQLEDITDATVDWYWDGVQQTSFTASGYAANTLRSVILGIYHPSNT